MTTRPCSIFRPGFTLTEILVVITILVVLAAVLLTVTGRIRESADNAKCTGYMRQIGIAMIAYSTENNARLPAVREEDPSGNSPGEVWFNAILPHLSETAFDSHMPEQSLICPVWQRVWRQKYPSAARSHWNRTGYGMSYVMVGSPTKGGPNWAKTGYAVRLTEIADPGRTIMVADAGGWNWGIHGTNYNTNAYFKPESGLDGGLRHGKGANFLFVDGHVLSLNKSGVYPYLAK